MTQICPRCHCRHTNESIYRPGLCSACEDDMDANIGAAPGDMRIVEVPTYREGPVSPCPPHAYEIEMAVGGGYYITLPLLYESRELAEKAIMDGTA